jgi:uncharacterized membrane protein HdeD (DUF308 family)
MSILSESNPDKETLLHGLHEDIALSWPFFLAEALCRVLMGFLLILIPPFLVLENLTHLYGWIFFSLALVGLLRAFKAQNLQGFLPALFTAAFTLVFGLVLLVYPLGPMLNLRSVLVLYLLIEGLSGYGFAFQFRHFRHASGSYFTSTMALLIALLLGLGWPEEQHFWQSSTLLGALYCLQGFLLLALALGMEHWVKQEDEKHHKLEPAAPLTLNNPPISRASVSAKALQEAAISQPANPVLERVPEQQRTLLGVTPVAAPVLQPVLSQPVSNSTPLEPQATLPVFPSTASASEGSTTDLAEATLSPVTAPLTPLVSSIHSKPFDPYANV